MSGERDGLPVGMGGALFSGAGALTTTYSALAVMTIPTEKSAAASRAGM